MTIEDVCAEQPLWDMSVVLAGDILPLPFETGLDDDVGVAARAVPAPEQLVAIAARD